MPKKPIIKILNMTKKHLQAVISIAEKQLGSSYIRAEDIINSENISLVATISGKVVGFCIGKKMAVSDLYKKIPQLSKIKLEHLQVVDEVGLVSSIATDATKSGKGIGTELLSECVIKLKESGLNVFVMTAWKSKKGIHIESLSKKLGFNNVLEIDNFWYEDSKTHGYSCPSCGEPPCECATVVFIKRSGL